jgi:hypothetical protein
MNDIITELNTYSINMKKNDNCIKTTGHTNRWARKDFSKLQFFFTDKKGHGDTVGLGRRRLRSRNQKCTQHNV